jgi:RimJ/RimL family protein N-acetyltransferase
MDGDLIVGSICLKHPPDAEGAVEVGYGIAPSHRRRGLATAAVTALLPLAYAAGASVVIADTEPHNVASIGVLERTGFSRESVDPDGRVWWRVSPST